MANISIQSSPNPLAPIQRTTPEQRVANFNAQSDSIYNKFSPYTSNFGFDQPFVYTKISDSNFSKNLTKYDSQAAPIGSTTRDVQRVGKFLTTGKGLLYTGKQYLLQNQNAFNETRVYNLFSPLKATAAHGALGGIDRPLRHVETSGGILAAFTDSVLSTIGHTTTDAKKPTIEGTATGTSGGTPFSTYSAAAGGARAGLVRYGTATSANSHFSKAWGTEIKKTNAGGGFLAKLGAGLKNSLSKMAPSTNPMGAFGGETDDKWEFRPEYPIGGVGVYDAFIESAPGFLSVDNKSVKQYHLYKPGSATKYGNFAKLSFNPVEIGVSVDVEGNVVTETTGMHNNLQSLYVQMFGPKAKYLSDTNSIGQVKESAERYTTVKGAGTKDTTTYPNYSEIPSAQDAKVANDYTSNLEQLRMTELVKSFKVWPHHLDPAQGNKSIESYGNVFDRNIPSRRVTQYKDIAQRAKGYYDNFETGMRKGDNRTLSVSNKGFAKVNVVLPNNINDIKLTEDNHDTYNAMQVIKGGDRYNLPTALVADGTLDQSKDIIFLYFFDLVNKVYVPFRATLSSVSDQHSAEWEDISYMGRADKLYVYKGFTREFNFAFTVYANSIKELVPMWERISYLVGLLRPSKYTEPAVITSEINPPPGYVFLPGRETSGAESRFIYPPMVTFRLGDMFYDQPGVIAGVSVSIPDDTNWESYRSDNDYSYLFGPKATVTATGVKSRQLPLKADISVSMKLLEKERAQVDNAHYGYNS